MNSYSEVFFSHKEKSCDKWESYVGVYSSLLADYKDKAGSILEIGVQRGGSLEILSKYFNNAEKIIGVDIDESCRDLRFSDPRISIVVGDSSLESVALDVFNISKKFDVIIDDGSHKSSDIIRSFFHYFRQLSDDGIYIIEDLHCSYLKHFEGGLFDHYSSISFCKCLVDVINFDFWGIPINRTAFLSSFVDRYNLRINENDFAGLASVSFFNSLCVIRKNKRTGLGRRQIVGGDVDTLSIPTVSLVIPSQEAFFGNRFLVPMQDRVANLEESLAQAEMKLKKIEEEYKDAKCEISRLEKMFFFKVNSLLCSVFFKRPKRK